MNIKEFNVMEGQERYPTIEITDLIEKGIQIWISWCARSNYKNA